MHEKNKTKQLIVDEWSTISLATYFLKNCSTALDVHRDMCFFNEYLELLPQCSFNIRFFRTSLQVTTIRATTLEFGLISIQVIFRYILSSWFIIRGIRIYDSFPLHFLLYSSTKVIQNIERSLEELLGHKWGVVEHE